MSDQEHEALSDEVRYWKRKAIDAASKVSEYWKRSCAIERPNVEVRRSSVDSHPVWWRVYVNGEYIDGHETEPIAEQIAARLRAAFVLKKPKKETT